VAPRILERGDELSLEAQVCIQVEVSTLQGRKKRDIPAEVRDTERLREERRRPLRNSSAAPRSELWSLRNGAWALHTLALVARNAFDGDLALHIAAQAAADRSAVQTPWVAVACTQFACDAL